MLLVAQRNSERNLFVVLITFAYYPDPRLRVRKITGVILIETVVLTCKGER